MIGEYFFPNYRVMEWTANVGNWHVSAALATGQPVCLLG